MAIVRVLIDIQQRTKSLTDINNWKAFDLKMFSFHIALVFASVTMSEPYFESFVTVSVAIGHICRV